MYPPLKSRQRKGEPPWIVWKHRKKPRETSLPDRRGKAQSPWAQVFSKEKLAVGAQAQSHEYLFHVRFTRITHREERHAKRILADTQKA